MTDLNFKEFRDPIHGFIGISEDELKIIEHPLFQRLRGIKQLSFGNLVYHGAEHTRFGHSLGVLNVVNRALNSIMKNSELVGQKGYVTEDDIKLARISVLLHDVGHFPFSHALDGVLPDEHEKYSSKLAKTEFAPLLDNAGLDPEKVGDMIEGNAPLDKPYLASLITGQLDVDKFDYLLRDSYYAGVKYGIYDIDRLLDSLCVKDNELLVLESGYFAAEQLIIARYHMFAQVYYHKTKRAFEEMVKKISRHMYDSNSLNYPSLSDLENNTGINELIKINDYWFLEKMKACEEPHMNRIAKMVNERIPYKVILDSGNIWKKINEKDPAAGRGVITAIESDISYSLSNLNIDKSEIIVDRFRNVAYKLKPYIRVEADESEEEEIVYVYNKKIDNKKPIEELSPIVKELATNISSTMRVYVDELKKETLLNFLNDKYAGLLG